VVNFCICFVVIRRHPPFDTRISTELGTKHLICVHNTDKGVPSVSVALVASANSVWNECCTCLRVFLTASEHTVGLLQQQQRRRRRPTVPRWVIDDWRPRLKWWAVMVRFHCCCCCLTDVMVYFVYTFSLCVQMWWKPLRTRLSVSLRYFNVRSNTAGYIASCPTHGLKTET